jgi:hypothetical protein
MSAIGPKRIRGDFTFEILFVFCELYFRPVPGNRPAWGGGACPYAPRGSSPLLIKLIVCPSARALDPLWNLNPCGTRWQNVRSKNSDSNSMAYMVGRTRTRTWDPLIKSQQKV